MDLGAYVQIPDLDKVAKANGIEIPRLRGYRLMKNETPSTTEEIESAVRSERDYWVKRNVNDAIQLFLINASRGSEEDISAVKILKDAKSDCWRADGVAVQMQMFNKYCGRDDILMIHARIGSSWRDFKDCEWFVDACDDGWDNTYCDIYARIKTL